MLNAFLNIRCRMMDKLLSQFFEILFEAAPQIDKRYWQFDAFGLEHVGYMERTYAYELYCKIRKVQDEKGYHDFTVQGEPEKVRTEFFLRIRDRLLREQRAGEDLKQFQKRVMPDFLVHIPYDLNGNISIVEIKPEKGKVTDGFKKDIRVIKELVDGAENAKGYHAGVSVLFNTRDGFNDLERLTSEYSDGIKAVLGEDFERYKKKICLFFHESPRSDLKKLIWCE